jgi:hypothetical protein
MLRETNWSYVHPLHAVDLFRPLRSVGMDTWHESGGAVQQFVCSTPVGSLFFSKNKLLELISKTWS